MAHLFSGGHCAATVQKLSLGSEQVHSVVEIMHRMMLHSSVCWSDAKEERHPRALPAVLFCHLSSVPP